MESYHKSGSWNNFPTRANSKTPKHEMNINVYNFQAAVKKLLNKSEQKHITSILQNYNRNRNAYYLAQSIKSLLDTPEKKCLISLLKQIIPKSDRPSFDQFTCEETYVRQPSHSRGSSLSHLYTNDSGIGSNNHHEQDFSSKASDFSNYKASRQPPPRRSSSLSDLSRKQEKSGKSFAGTFGSAVRRKVRAVLTRRGSSSSVELRSTVQRRCNSETKLNRLEQHDGEPKSARTEPPTKLTGERSMPDSPASLVRVTLRRGKKREFGFTIGGGSEVDSGIFISEVEPGSPADLAGLSKGDVIVKVNDLQFDIGVSHDTAATVLSTLDRLTMLVKPFKSPHYEGADLPWTDVHGRPSSPPHTLSKRGNQFPKPVLDSRRSSVHLLQIGERKVNLTVRPKQSLGLVIRGGSEYDLGIYVTAVDALSAAEVAGLKVGDEILEVNNVQLTGATHAEAVSAIKSSSNLVMVVRYVGKVPRGQPNAKKALDDRVSLHSTTKRKSNNGMSNEHRNGVKATFQRKLMKEKQLVLPNKPPARQSTVRVSAVMAALEEAVLSSTGWMELTKFQRRSVRYYVKEYALGNVDTDALVITLTEALDTSEKFSLMSAVRECIDVRDLDRFDVLLLRKEVEWLRNHQGSQTSGNDSSCSVDAASQLSVPSDDHPCAFDPETCVQSSTPQGSSQRRGISLSPVRPPSSPPPPPKTKQPPPKPKRNNSLTRPTTLESLNSSTNEEEAEDVNSKTSDDRDSRPSSPFTIALENHRSSHSGRVKVGNKASHPPLPKAEFFKDPKEDVPVEPVYRSIIKPVKNPASHLLKARRISRNPSSSLTTPSDQDGGNQGACSTNASSSSSSSESTNMVPHPPLQKKFTFRSASFSASANEKAARGHQRPIKVDVHRDPSVKETIRISPNQTIQKSKAEMASASHTSASASGCDMNSSTGEDLESFLLSDDVERQKVVVFRRASNLGLTIEGGAGTKQPLPRILRIQPGSCAQLSGRIHVGHVIHEVNGLPLSGLEHHDAVRSIALAFKQEDRDSIEFVLSGPY